MRYLRHGMITRHGKTKNNLKNLTASRGLNRRKDGNHEKLHKRRIGINGPRLGISVQSGKGLWLYPHTGPGWHRNCICRGDHTRGCYGSRSRLGPEKDQSINSKNPWSNEIINHLPGRGLNRRKEGKNENQNRKNNTGPVRTWPMAGVGSGKGDIYRLPHRGMPNSQQNWGGRKWKTKDCISGLAGSLRSS